MSNLALMEVQRGIYNKLQGDGVLMGMVSGVYDVAPQNAALPFVVIGDGIQRAIAADNSAITECSLELHIWSDTGGRKTTLAIMNRLHGLLHLGTITLSGYQLVILRCEQASAMLTESATRIHGMLMLQVAVVEN